MRRISLIWTLRYQMCNRPYALCVTWWHQKSGVYRSYIQFLWVWYTCFKPLLLACSLASYIVHLAIYLFHFQPVNCNNYLRNSFICTQLESNPTSSLGSSLAFFFPFGLIMQESMPSSISRGGPKSTYYHNGIGGRGNYHKRAEDADTSFRQSRSHFARSLAAVFCRACSGDVSKQYMLEEEADGSTGKGRGLRFPSKWLIGIGALGSCEARKQHSSSRDMSATTVTHPDYASQAPLLGAAYVIRRKILGQQSAPKPGEE